MKMLKLKKPKSLSMTLVIFSAIILLILNTISAVCIGILTSQGMNEKEDAFLHQTTNSAKSQVEDYIERYITIAETLVTNGEVQRVFAAGSPTSPLSAAPEFQSMLRSLQDVMGENSDILGMGFGSISENHMYDQAGTRYDVLLSERPYFSSASQHTFVTQPSIDTATGEMCVSIATPVRSNNAVLGILIVDLKLTGLSDFLTQLSFGESGRAILLSEDNTIIGYENRDVIGTNFKDVGATGELLAELDKETPSSEVLDYQLNGEARKCAVAKLSGGNWKVISTMSKAEYSAATMRTVSFLAIVLTLTTIIIAVALRIIIIRKLRPIKDIVKAADDISNGNLDIQIEVQSEDEIGNLARIFLSMSATLKSIIDDINYLLGELSEGNFRVASRVQERYTGDYENILMGLRRIRDTLSDTLRNISVSADQVSAGSDQVASGAQALAQGATEQASSVQELSASALDISERINHNAERAEMAQTQTAKTKDSLEHSSQKMQELIAAMDQIKATSGQIQGIIKTIDDIAFQTNILALNAAVEAARAGSAGKGFAVVVGEVRNLAAKSAEASKTTQELILASIGAVENGSALAAETSQVLSETADGANLVMTSITEIAEASAKQATAVSQITQGLDQISSVVQTNSATSEQSAAASEELSSQAQVLKNLIGQFQLPDLEDHPIAGVNDTYAAITGPRQYPAIEAGFSMQTADKY